MLMVFFSKDRAVKHIKIQVKVHKFTAFFTSSKAVHWGLTLAPMPYV